MCKQQTVNKRSLSLEVIVDGEKWSFRRTVCLMMFRRLRTAATRDSAEPEAVSGVRTLQHYELAPISYEYILRIPLKSTSFCGPIPEGHLKRVYKMQMTIQVKEIALSCFVAFLKSIIYSL